MNVETCGHVADLIVMAHAFAELRDGVVARQHENGFKCGHNFAQTLYLWIALRARYGFISLDRECPSVVSRPSCIQDPRRTARQEPR
eukprot:scaffold27518_cov66-Phaeocystis_antarctica.AAC.3